MAAFVPVTEVDRLKSRLADCQALGVWCLVCRRARARLRELGELHALVPPEHRALSSGRLGTPERNRRCPDCSGLGRVTREGCPRCLSTGELTYRNYPGLPDSSDRVTRKRLAAARDAGLVGRKS